MCVKQRDGYAVIFNCGDVACIKDSMAFLAEAARDTKRHHVVQDHWRVRGLNPEASTADLAVVKKPRARA